MYHATYFENLTGSIVKLFLRFMYVCVRNFGVLIHIFEKSFYFLPIPPVVLHGSVMEIR